MTFFLNEQQDARPARSAPSSIPTYTEALGAQVRASALENDANFKAWRTQVTTEEQLARDVFPRLDRSRIFQEIEARNQRALDAGMPSQVQEVPENLADAIDILGPNFAKRVLDVAREAAEADPEKWADVDLSPEGIDKRINDKLKAEYQDAQDIIAMTPDGFVGEGFLGGMIGTTLDLKNLPFLALGGGSGSLMRVMGREAMINASAEAAFMPSQFEMADRLGIEDPKVLAQLGQAAVFGGVLGAGFELVGRAIGFFRRRNQIPEASGLPDTPDVQAAVNQIEDAIADPVGNIREEVERRIPSAPPPPPEPLILTPDQRTDVDAKLDEDFAVQREREVEDRITALEADYPVMKQKRPLAQALRRLGAIQYKRRNPVTGEMELTPAGQELRHRGVTPKTHAYLFNNKTGRASLDNISPSEISEGFDGVLPLADDGLYLDPDALIERLADEVTGGAKTPMSPEIAAIMREIEGVQQPTPVQDYLAMEPAPGGLFIDLNSDRYAFSPEDAPGMIRADVDDYFTQTGADVELTPSERAEITDQLIKNGGEAEDLIMAALERNGRFVETPDAEIDAGAEDIPFGDVGAAYGQGTVRPGPVASEAGGGRADQAHGGAAFEQTDAGEQSVTPGVEPITARDRLEAQQNAPLRGGNAAADDGLFDLNIRQQMDIFSDLGSPEVQAAQEAELTALKAQVADGGDFDLEMELEDGTRLTKASDVIRHIEADEDFADIIDLCGRAPTE